MCAYVYKPSKDDSVNMDAADMAGAVYKYVPSHIRANGNQAIYNYMHDHPPTVKQLSKFYTGKLPMTKKCIGELMDNGIVQYRYLAIMIALQDFIIEQKD